MIQLLSIICPLYHPKNSINTLFYFVCCNFSTYIFFFYSFFLLFIFIFFNLYLQFFLFVIILLVLTIEDLDEESLRLEEDYNKNFLLYEGFNLSEAFKSHKCKVDKDWGVHEHLLEEDYRSRRFAITGKIEYYY